MYKTLNINKSRFNIIKKYNYLYMKKLQIFIYESSIVVYYISN